MSKFANVSVIQVSGGTPYEVVDGFTPEEIMDAIPVNPDMFQQQFVDLPNGTRKLILTANTGSKGAVANRTITRGEGDKKQTFVIPRATTAFPSDAEIEIIFDNFLEKDENIFDVVVDPVKLQDYLNRLPKHAKATAEANRAALLKERKAAFKEGLAAIKTLEKAIVEGDHNVVLNSLFNAVAGFTDKVKGYNESVDRTNVEKLRTFDVKAYEEELLKRAQAGEADKIKD